MTGDPNNTRITAITVGDVIVDGMSSRVFWGPTLITYAFPDARADYDPANYDPTSAVGETAYFSAFSVAQQNFAKSTMLASYGNTANDGFSIEGFTNVTFTAGADTSANIRFGNANPTTGMDAWTYHAFPDQIQGGDIWIHSSNVPGYSSPNTGDRVGWTLLHELGHSMGLDHPFGVTHGTLAMRDTMGHKYEGMEYTAMAYNGWRESNSNFSHFTEVGSTSFPQTYMMHDIYTLQYMYGADYTVNSGNTTYSWDGISGDTLVNGSVGVDAIGNKIFATIWDGGGIDTYDLSAYSSNLRLDLSPGKSSRFSTTQSAELGDGVLAAGNIYNALMFGGNTASLIENAIGGSGADTLDGNSANNTLTGNQGADLFEGGLGNDTIIGNGGLDVLNGGQGNDTLSGGIGGSNADTFLFKGTTIGNDVITDWQNGIDYIRFEAATATSFSQLSIIQSGANVVIDMPNNADTITINNATVSQFTAADFLFS